MDDSLSIVLPVFNEEKNIKAIISDIFHCITDYIRNFEVIVIDDGSADNTKVILAEAKKTFTNLKIIFHEKNKGYGCAIRAGIQSSTKEWIFIMDSDGQFKINDFKAFWMKRQDNNFILGFRKKRKDNLYRVLLGSIGSFVASSLLRKRIIDANCGFKLFKNKELKTLLLYSAGGLIWFEILYNLLRNNAKKFTQYPVNHYPREYGSQTGGSPRTLIKILFEGIKVLSK